MRALNPSEKRTIFICGLIIVLYFSIFGLPKSWRSLNPGRADYEQLRDSAEKLKREVDVYTNRVLRAQKLMEGFQMDPAKLYRTSVVAQASAAIQKAAAGGGMQVGPVRESPARGSNKELISMQLEGSGPVPAVVAFLSRLESVGFPLVIDSVQLTPDMRPGQLKLSLTLVILDFDQWKEPPHA
jgi:hypothetical protein